MLEKIKRFVVLLESAPMSVLGWLMGFAGWLWVRYFLEAFSSPNVSGYLPSDLPTLLHYALFYIATIMVTVVVVGAVTRIPSLSMMHMVIYLLPIMWLAPLIDLAFGGAHMTYLFAATPTILFADFFTYFGPLTGSGVTLGMRIELGLFFLVLGGYVYLHTKRLSTALIGVLGGYISVFLIGSLPSLITFFLPTVADGSLRTALQSSLISHDFLHPAEMHSAYRTFELFFDAMMAQALYVISVIFGIVWLYRTRKDVVVAMLQNIRAERVAHFLVMVLLGGFIALSAGSKINWTILDVTTVVVASFTVIFACMFAIVANDLVDEPIDAISNTERPLVTGALTRDMMRDAGLVCGLMTLVGALTLGSYATFWILVFSAAYYIYSVPPLRLKRVPILASLLIGFATLALMLFGFFLVSTNQALGAFPAPIALLVVLFMTLVANIRDLKDIEGDTVAGVWTLPTLLGDRRARMVIGAMTFIASTLVPIFIPIPVLWIPSLIAGAVSWVGLISGKGERFVFSLYFVYLISIVFLLRFS